MALAEGNLLNKTVTLVPRSYSSSYLISSFSSTESSLFGGKSGADVFKVSKLT